jgi:peroxiredoxin
MDPCARLFIVLLSACSTAPVATPDVPAVLVGRAAPELTVTNLDGGGGSVSLSALRGDVVVVYFWATRCEACKAEFPRLEALYERLKPEGLAVVAVGQDEPSEADRLSAFLRSYGATFPAGWDKGHLIAEAYRPGDLPTTYIIDQKGSVRFQHFGYRPGDERELEREVTMLLEAK